MGLFSKKPRYCVVHPEVQLIQVRVQDGKKMKKSWYCRICGI